MDSSDINHDTFTTTAYVNHILQGNMDALKTFQQINANTFEN